MDVLERTDIYDQNRDTFLMALLDSDFSKLVNERLAGYNVGVNDKYNAEKPAEE